MRVHGGRARRGGGITGAAHEGHAATLRDYLHVLRRRKWIVLQAVVLVPAAAIAFSLHQQKLYQAQAKVLLSAQNLAAQLTGTQNTGVSEPQSEIVQTQAEVARVPDIAAAVLRRVPAPGLTVQGFLSASGVSASPNADILTFSVTNHDPVLAERLVDEYASAYTVYRRRLDTSAIHNALASVDERIRRLVKAGGGRSSLYSSLIERQETLATMSALQTSNASVVQNASKATLTQPKTSRNGILGLFLGIVLGIGLAFLWEALDTRVRSAQEIGARLGLPLLGRIPAPRKSLRESNRLVMLGDPSATEAEAFRMLRTSLEFATLGRDVRSIMITSAVEQEGKSTTIANLAVALARAGQRVILVDLDLRRPYLDRFFNLQGPGITQVALGRATLEEALTQGTVALTVRPARPAAAAASASAHVRVTANGNGYGDARALKGVLAVLPSGPTPPDPGEFVGTAALSELLVELRSLADVVLVDAPPVLHVGDALTLSSKVDGIIVATKMKIVRRHMLGELARQLAGSPTPVLGYVVTGAQEDGGYGYGYDDYGYAPRPYERREHPERVGGGGEA